MKPVTDMASKPIAKGKGTSMTETALKELKNREFYIFMLWWEILGAASRVKKLI